MAVLTKEVKVGLLALVAGIILYIGFNFLKGVDFFSPTKKYYVIYPDIAGLTAANPVTLNGLTVGRVNAIKLLTERNNMLLVELDVDDAVIVGDCTVALLSSADILGAKTIDLKLGNNTRIFENEDTLRGFKPQSMTDMLGAKALPIMTNLDSTVVKLNRMFGDELGVSIQKTLHNLELASHGLNQAVIENRGNINSISSNLAALTKSLKETEASVKPLIAKMSVLADSLNDLELKKTVNTANAALQNLETVTKKINEGQGSIGALINDKTLYNNLNSSAKDLDALFIDIKKNPKKYVHFSVFGGGKKQDKKAAAVAPAPEPAK